MTTITLDATTRPTSVTATSPRLRTIAVVAGAVIGSAGHLLHPLTHSDAARASSRFELAHVLMAVGATLVLVGIPLLRRRFGGDQVASVVLGAFWLGNLAIIPTVLLEGVVGPRVSTALNDEIVDAAAWLGVLGMAYLLGFLGMGVLGWRRGVLAKPVAAVLVAGAVLLLLLPGLPGTEGYWIIPTMVLLNAAVAVAALDPC